MKIFINYRRKDSPGYAIALQQKLGLIFGKENVFLDVETLVAGQEVDDKIEDFLLTCTVFICLIGEDWLNAKDPMGNRRLENPNDFVRREIEIALKNKIPFIPVLINTAQIPKEEWLPDSMKLLSGIQALEIGDRRFESDTNRLIDVLRIHAKDVDNQKIEKRINDLLFNSSEFRDIFKRAKKSQE
ncbi:MAG: toll/interleukin-1 receptor domain-containing protein [Anaerolineae bacterium]|nr:toll/interleukin-1 receptor domain-containing protein [Anaerolineae bacterium]